MVIGALLVILPKIRKHMNLRDALAMLSHLESRQRHSEFLSKIGRALIKNTKNWVKNE